jgi:hypothetical protein
MGFASGFVTGLAKSVDDQLKNDMLRTQKRMDGMEQYRVTRKRADIERKQKEGNELAETIQKLASFTGGNLDYAEQVYLAVGGNIADANAYYDVLKENQAVTKNFKLTDHVKFGEMVRSKDVTAKEVAANYIDGIKETKSENVKGYGLLSLFDRSKSGEQIDKKVNEQVATTESAFGLVKRNANQLAKIDHSGMIAYKEHQKKNRRKYGTSYVSDLIILEGELSNETDPTKKKDLEAEIRTRRNDVLVEAAGKNKKDGSTSFFSKPNRDTIVKSAIDATMKKYEQKSVDGTITLVMKGNEVDIFNNKALAINNLRKTWAPAGDAFLNSDINNQQTILEKEIDIYKKDVYSDPDKRAKVFKPITSPADGLAQTKPTLDTSGKIIEEAKIKKGDMVRLPNGELRLWNGFGFI